MPTSLRALPLAGPTGAHASRARIDGTPVPAVLFQAATVGVGDD
ncbi:hypothetical protein [Thermomonas mangrovi]|nr:hypothetical protein [Thermomonas mangrovi]